MRTWSLRMIGKRPVKSRFGAPQSVSVHMKGLEEVRQDRLECAISSSFRHPSGEVSISAATMSATPRRLAAGMKQEETYDRPSTLKSSEKL